jgi:hypothetical protein
MNSSNASGCRVKPLIRLQVYQTTHSSVKNDLQAYSRNPEKGVMGLYRKIQEEGHLVILLLTSPLLQQLITTFSYLPTNTTKYSGCYP